MVQLRTALRTPTRCVCVLGQVPQSMARIRRLVHVACEALRLLCPSHELCVELLQGTSKEDIPPYLGDEEGSGPDSDGENDPPAKQ